MTGSFPRRRDGSLDVVIGRADGLVEVLACADATPRVSWSQSLHEAIHTVQCGGVSSPNFDDIVVCTFAGRLTAFSNEPMRNDGFDEGLADRAAAKVEALASEVAALREKVAKAREKAEKGGQQVASNASRSFVPRWECALDVERACYEISLELPVPIDLVHLRASSRLDLLDDGADALAVVSTAVPEERHDAPGKPTTKLLATFRCQESQHALRFRVRTVEGEPGDLRCVVVARGEPKIARVVDFRVPALSLHRRVHELSAAQLGRPKNVLTLEGSFTAQNAHDWFSQVLPECPPRIQPRSTAPRPRSQEAPRTPEAKSEEAEIPRDSLRLSHDSDEEFEEIVREARAAFGKARDDDAEFDGALREARGEVCSRRPLRRWRGMYYRRDAKTRPRAQAKAEPEAKAEPVEETKGPEPARPPPITDLAHRLCFENVYTGGVVECDYEANRARVCSDSISALAILKEHVSREAVRLRQDVHDHLSMEEASIPSFLQLIDPKLKYQRKLAERVELIDAIHEIATAEEDTRWLDEEYRYIHENADALRKEHAKAPQALQYLTGVVADFFVDSMKARGIDGHSKLAQLDALLLAASYDLAKLVAFFDPALHKSPSRDGLSSLGI